MKTKLKLDKDSLQQFFLENAEKFIFGLVALVALLMIFQALTHKGYEKTPQQLLDKSRDADKKIDATLPEVPIECHSAEFEKLVRRILLPIDGTAYAYKNPWDVPVASALRPRPQPKFFPAEKLCGVGGAGRFSERDVRGDRGAHYVVLTALVPLEQQTEEYLRAFERVRYQDPQGDAAPQYHSVRIERAIVPSSGQNQDLTWEDVTAEINEAAAQWQTSDAEVVNPKYLYGAKPVAVSLRRGGHTSTGQNALVAALPRTSREWGASAHASRDPAGQAGCAPRKWPRDGVPWSRLPTMRKRRRPPKSLKRHRMKKRRTRRRSTSCCDSSISPSSRESPIAIGCRWCSSIRTTGCPPHTWSMPTSPHSNTSNKGAVANSKDRYIPAPTTKPDDPIWSRVRSEPSDVISVPQDIQVLVEKVAPPGPRAFEPAADVVMLDWQEDNGQTVHQIFPSLVRGKVLNFPDTLFNVLPPSAVVVPPRHPHDSHEHRPKVETKKDQLPHGRGGRGHGGRRRCGPRAAVGQARQSGGPSHGRRRGRVSYLGCG